MNTAPSNEHDSQGGKEQKKDIVRPNTEPFGAENIPPVAHSSVGPVEEHTGLRDGHEQSPTPNDHRGTGRTQRRRRGRKRGQRSMGRYPFLAHLNEYLTAVKSSWVESTWKNERRRLRHIYKTMETLKNEGKMTTTNPDLMEEADIQAWIAVRRASVGPSTFKKDMDALTWFLAFVGNPVMSRMKARRQLPKIAKAQTEPELKALDEEEILLAQNTAEGIEGWWGSVCRFIAWMYPYTGLRPSELRLAHREDLNTDKWEIWVRHPKGELTYGKRRTVPIPAPARPAVFRYLSEREAMLKMKGTIEEPELIPKRQGTGPYSATCYRRVKQCIINLGGGEWAIRDMRTTYAQRSIDLGVQPKSVSRALGHASTQTTEKYYGRIRTKDANDEINKAYEDKVQKSAD